MKDFYVGYPGEWAYWEAHADYIATAEPRVCCSECKVNVAVMRGGGLRRHGGRKHQCPNRGNGPASLVRI